MGELVGDLMRMNLSDDEKQRYVGELIELLHNLGAAIVPASGMCYEKTQWLLANDDRLSNHINDAYIVCQALCDPDSTVLLYSGEKVWNSRAIEELQTDMLNSGERRQKLGIQAHFTRRRPRS
jgi:hypothetical protein